MKFRFAVLLGMILLVGACGSSAPAVIPADFAAEVEVVQDETVKVDDTNLKIKLTSTGKAILLDNSEVYEVQIELSGIDDEVTAYLEDVGENSSVEYGGYRIALRTVSIYGDSKSARFEVSAAPE